MSMKSSHALLAALALIAGPAFAQDAAPATEAPATEAPAPETPAATPAEAAAETPAAPETEAAADTPVATEDSPVATEDSPAAEAEAEAVSPAADADAAPEQERPGGYYAKAEHGDWTIRCIDAGQGKDPCEMYKLLSDADDNAVAELTLIPLSNGNVAAGATLVAPLETDLIEGLGFQVDSGEMRGYPFSFCAAPGCVSRLGFTADEVTAMKRGNRATVQLMPFGGNPDNPVQLGFSLAGFTAAFDELVAYAAEPAPEAEAEAAQ